MLPKNCRRLRYEAGGFVLCSGVESRSVHFTSMTFFFLSTAMRTGYAPGYIGPIGSADSGGKMARRAEDRGYENLWRVERLSHPVDPQSPYPVTPHAVLAHQ